jgi:two-component system, NarL family, sensor kinase
MLFMEEQGSYIVSLVLVGIAAMFILIITFLLMFNLSQRRKFRYRQEVMSLREEQQNLLIEAAIKGEEGERKRIAEELHDDVGALLSATKLYMHRIDTGPLNEADRFSHDKCIELLGESINKVRTISHNLHSIMMEDMGLNEGIRSFLRKLEQSNSLAITIELDESYTPFSGGKDINVYRIIQELCNNILKHAAAKSLTVRSWPENKHINFQLQHDGNGLSQAMFEALRYQSNGLGLKNIQNRIALLKGAIRFDLSEGASSVLLKIPSEENASARFT